MSKLPILDSRFDLKIERTVDVPKELIWKAWTTPEHLMPWFCPKPWSTVECEIDLRPGGMFRTTMQSPEGEKFPNMGCYLEVIENHKLVWTDTLLPGFRPAPHPESGAGLFFTAFVILEDHGKGTKYTAIALHRDEKDKEQHEEMGFTGGWNTVLDQLVVYAQNNLKH